MRRHLRALALVLLATTARADPKLWVHDDASAC